MKDGRINLLNRAGLKLRRSELNINSKSDKENASRRKLNKIKRKKTKSSRRKDEENILSKDIDVEEEMKELDRMNENRGMKPRDISNLNYSKNYMKNLKFRPFKYKGNYLPYHLRWIFNNNVKSSDIALIQEVEALENEINRLKQMKSMNREFRKIANLPFGISTSPCVCCKKIEKKKHDCTHEFCEPECVKKKAELQAIVNKDLFNSHGYIPQALKKKLLPGFKAQIFGLVERSKDRELAENKLNAIEKKPVFIIKK